MNRYTKNQSTVMGICPRKKRKKKKSEVCFSVPVLHSTVNEESSVFSSLILISSDSFVE